MRKYIRIIFLIIFLVLFIFFTMCGLPYSKKCILEDDELSWIFSQKENDTLIFYCKELNSTDTVIIKEIEIHNPKTSIPIPEDLGWIEGDHIFKGSGSICFSMKHNSIDFQCLVTIIKENNDSSALFDIAFCGNYLIEQIKINESTEVVYNRESKKDLIIINKHQLETGQSQEIIPVTQIIWSRDSGLLNYSISNYKFILENHFNGK